MKLLVTIGDQSELKIGFLAAPGSLWCIWISRASALSVARITGWCVMCMPGLFFVHLTRRPTPSTFLKNWVFRISELGFWFSKLSFAFWTGFSHSQNWVFNISILDQGNSVLKNRKMGNLALKKAKRKQFGNVDDSLDEDEIDEDVYDDVK